MQHLAENATVDQTQSLRALAEARRFFVGTAVDMRALASEPAYTETLAREFNMAVAENAFKPSEVWITPYEYDFSVTDQLADFAARHGMVLRGHTLVWHQQTPRWLSPNARYTASEMRDMLRTYIQTLVERYKGRIAMWDVVNEAIADPTEDGEEPTLRAASPWHRTLGPNYLKLAFEWAHEADPDARLYYNDYEIEDLGPKSDAVYRLVKDLQQQGAPIYGVGFQGHLINGWREDKSHRMNFRRFADLGLEWQITEADIRMPLDGNEPTPEQLAEQAAGYGDLLRLCLTEPGCRGFVAWGFTDARSWIPGFRKGWGAALPLDATYQPKPAYHAMAEALRSHPAPVSPAAEATT